MKFKLSGLLCSKLDIIDDAEQTPGHSREMTRFRHQCYEPIVKGMIKIRPSDKYTDLAPIDTMIKNVLEKNNFKLRNRTYHLDERDALVSADFWIESTEE